MSGSYMTYCLQIDKIVGFLAISWSLSSILPALMIMKTSLVVFMINTAVMQCVMSLFEARAV